MQEIARSSLRVCKLVRLLMDLSLWALILERKVHCQEFKGQQKRQNKKKELRIKESEKDKKKNRQVRKGGVM